MVVNTDETQDTKTSYSLVVNPKEEIYAIPIRLKEYHEREGGKNERTRIRLHSGLHAATTNMVTVLYVH